MKIKSWLLLTYLLVMILPLLTLYGLYVSINAHYQDKNVEEYFEKWNIVTDMKSVLDDPALYTRRERYDELKSLSSEQLMVTLYSANGRILYSSHPLTAYNSFELRNNVYKNLYELKQNYETFVYKEPVYENGTIKGIYKITLVRTEWLEQVNTKTALVVSGLVVVLLLLYGVVVYFLNVRLNYPAKRLIEQMRAFAQGEKTHSLPIKKDELGELTSSFQAMQQEITSAREKLEVEQRQKEFMVASLSHDLKTPLTSIQAYTESLLAGRLTESEKREYLQIIGAKSDYMKQLLDDLMMFTLLQSPTYAMELVKVEGSEFFEMLVCDYEQISIEKGFEATTMIQVNDSYRVNPKQLMRVVDNIVSNAWTYTNPGGEIHIAAFELPHIPIWCQGELRAQLTKKGIYIVVQNSGMTLSKEQSEQMFEPLYQIDESRSSIGQRGAGLGLSIAKRIIEKHNGTIQAISNNSNTAIIVWLPKEKEQ